MPKCHVQQQCVSAAKLALLLYIIKLRSARIRIGLVARIPRFHRGGRGSIPRCGTFWGLGLLLGLGCAVCCVCCVH